MNKSTKKKVTKKEEKEPFKLQITIEKVMYIILLAEKEELSGSFPTNIERRRLCDAIDLLPEREQHELAAIAYFGRGSFHNIEEAFESTDANMRNNLVGRRLDKYLKEGLISIPPQLFKR